MCGIAGFLSIDHGMRPEFLRRASSILRHRGPDDEGYLLLDSHFQVHQASGPDSARTSAFYPDISEYTNSFFQAGLLHRRLSIIAPDASGHQPMADASGQIWISYNGEIYNYKALRRELASLGCSFRTETDTEVLLQAWIQWGPDCLNKLDGMWAFAVLDLRTKQFFAATDPAGIKPFYYRNSPGKFAFASEIKALLQEGFSLNQREVARYLVWGQSDESSETLLNEVHRLQGGHSLQHSLMREESPRISRWHSLDVSQKTGFYTENEFHKEADEIRDLLREVVSLRLQADVPLGLCLSGGIDSSSIAGLVASLSGTQNLRFPAKSFMAVLPPGQQPDESAYAEMMAKTAGLEFHRICPGPEDFVQAAWDMIYSLDGPPPGMNAFSQYSVFRMVSEHGIKVTLDGQGADELFGGYPLHLEAALMENLSSGSADGFQPGLFKRMLGNQLRNFLPSELSIALLLQKKKGMKLLPKEVLELAGHKTLHRENGLNNCLLNDYQSGILPFLLKAADRNSMRWSVESRMPFADSAVLTSRLFALPGNMKIRHGESKSLLRAAMQQIVPPVILQRRDKVGFAAPNHEWLGALLRSEAIRDLPDCPEWADTKLFRKHADAFLMNNNNNDIGLLWRVIAFRIWMNSIIP
jgi:asparagine synthase (glutamine-hydrolysing)